ncbi:MAG: hypothetical protein KatS3mg031_0674 [Chitinophagales bacterium]|nr:MAG: hypothetical protein KatS3mg031_0674 [Chitinophagales bacterium]
MKNLIQIIVLLTGMVAVAIASNQLHITGVTQDNSTCDFSVPSCPCEGKMRSLTLLYNGPNGSDY